MNRFASKYAVGAVSRSQEIIDLIIETRKEKKAIRLWCVGQMGHISPFYLTSRSRYVASTKKENGSSCVGPAFNRVFGYVDHSSIGRTKTKTRWFASHILMGTYDIDGSSGFDPEHRLFTNRLAAERYSECLKADAEYVAGVKRHWARCDMLFRGMMGA